MIIYLNSHDFPNEIYSRHLRSDGTYNTRDVRVIVASADTSVAAMAASVIHNVHTGEPIPERSIWRLIINSHGNAGYIAIGGGIRMSNVEDLAVLRSYFTPLPAGGHGVLIDACLVAADAPPPRTYRENSWSPTGIDYRDIGAFSGRIEGQGLQFLRRMARVLNTKVTASTQIMYTGRDSVDGTFIRVFPDGHFQHIYQRTLHDGWHHSALPICGH